VWIDHVPEELGVEMIVDVMTRFYFT
jgi:hypothetical protein